MEHRLRNWCFVGVPHLPHSTVIGPSQYVVDTHILNGTLIVRAIWNNYKYESKCFDNIRLNNNRSIDRSGFCTPNQTKNQTNKPITDL